MIQRRLADKLAIAQFLPSSHVPFGHRGSLASHSEEEREEEPTFACPFGCLSAALVNV
jgi:hypothetical protein